MELLVEVAPLIHAKTLDLTEALSRSSGTREWLRDDPWGKRPSRLRRMRWNLRGSGGRRRLRWRGRCTARIQGRGVWCSWRARRISSRGSLSGRRRGWLRGCGFRCAGTVLGFSAVSLLLIDGESRVEESMYGIYGTATVLSNLCWSRLAIQNSCCRSFFRLPIAMPRSPPALRLLNTDSA